jgi:hypothetical protein
MSVFYLSGLLIQYCQSTIWLLIGTNFGFVFLVINLFFL